MRPGAASRGRGKVADGVDALGEPELDAVARLAAPATASWLDAAEAIP
jgi:hypothetical protein